MFTKAERELLKIGRAVIDLHGFFIVTEEKHIVDNPVLMVDLLTKIELQSFKALLTQSARETYLVEESVVYEKVLNIIGTGHSKIHVGLTPAGVISSIANCIIKESERIVMNENNSAFYEARDSVNYVEVMCNIISFYMNTPYDQVINLPINEIYKRYAIVQQSFPTQVEELQQAPSS